MTTLLFTSFSVQNYIYSSVSISIESFETLKFELHLFFCNYMNESLDILKVQVIDPLPKRRVEVGVGGGRGEQVTTS